MTSNKKILTYSYAWIAKKEVQPINTYKSEICCNWLTGEKCRFGEYCIFAHGLQQLKIRKYNPPKYKTQLCENLENTGYCKHSSRCRYIHKPNKLTNKQIESWLFISEIEKKDDFYIIEEVLRSELSNFIILEQSNRLPYFKEICND